MFPASGDANVTTVGLGTIGAKDPHPAYIGTNKAPDR